MERASVNLVNLGDGQQGSREGAINRGWSGRDYFWHDRRLSYNLDEVKKSIKKHRLESGLDILGGFVKPT